MRRRGYGQVKAVAGAKGLRNGPLGRCPLPALLGSSLNLSGQEADRGSPRAVRLIYADVAPKAHSADKPSASVTTASTLALASNMKNPSNRHVL